MASPTDNVVSEEENNEEVGNVHSSCQSIAGDLEVARCEERCDDTPACLDTKGEETSSLQVAEVAKMSPSYSLRLTEDSDLGIQETEVTGREITTSPYSTRGTLGASKRLSIKKDDSEIPDEESDDECERITQLTPRALRLLNNSRRATHLIQRKALPRLRCDLGDVVESLDGRGNEEESLAPTCEIQQEIPDPIACPPSPRPSGSGILSKLSDDPINPPSGFWKSRTRNLDSAFGSIVSVGGDFPNSDSIRKAVLDLITEDDGEDPVLLRDRSPSGGSSLPFNFTSFSNGPRPKPKPKAKPKQIQTRRLGYWAGKFTAERKFVPKKKAAPPTLLRQALMQSLIEAHGRSYVDRYILFRGVGMMDRNEIKVRIDGSVFPSSSPGTPRFGSLGGDDRPTDHGDGASKLSYRGRNRTSPYSDAKWNYDDDRSTIYSTSSHNIHRPLPPAIDITIGLGFDFSTGSGNGENSNVINEKQSPETGFDLCANEYPHNVAGGDAGDHASSPESFPETPGSTSNCKTSSDSPSPPSPELISPESHGRWDPPSRVLNEPSCSITTPRQLHVNFKVGSMGSHTEVVKLHRPLTDDSVTSSLQLSEHNFEENEQDRFNGEASSSSLQPSLHLESLSHQINMLEDKIQSLRDELVTEVRRPGSSSEQNPATGISSIGPATKSSTQLDLRRNLHRPLPKPPQKSRSPNRLFTLSRPSLESLGMVRENSNPDRRPGRGREDVVDTPEDVEDISLGQPHVTVPIIIVTPPTPPLPQNRNSSQITDPASRFGHTPVCFLSVTESPTGNLPPAKSHEDFIRTLSRGNDRQGVTLSSLTTSSTPENSRKGQISTRAEGVGLDSESFQFVNWDLSASLDSPFSEEGLAFGKSDQEVHGHKWSNRWGLTMGLHDGY